MKYSSVPVLIIAFNRPHKIKKVIQALSAIKPKRVFISIDGAREGNSRDEANQQEILNIIKKIDWQSKVQVNRMKKNLGCKNAVSSAITWFFDQVESGIILEDDCIPNESFFKFAAEMLEKYKSTPQVMSIAGSSLVKNITVESSYYFSSTPICWGWATWKHAWKHFDVHMRDWPQFKKDKQLELHFNNTTVQEYWTKIFDKTHAGKIDTWDYQWVFAILRSNGICITPTKNLVTNVGFDQESTHTKLAHIDHAYRQSVELEFPLKHPKSTIVDQDIDNIVQSQLYAIPKWKYFLLLGLGTFKHRILKA